MFAFSALVICYQRLVACLLLKSAMKIDDRPLELCVGKEAILRKAFYAQSYGDTTEVYTKALFRLPHGVKGFV